MSARVRVIVRSLAYACCALAIAAAIAIYTFPGRVVLVRADPTYYPRVLAIVDAATPLDRERMLTQWASFMGTESVSALELHRFLWSRGYCTNLISTPNCTEPPQGSEAQGIAKDTLANLSERYRK